MGKLKMVTFEASVEVNQPIDRVFSFATNFENNSRWLSGHLESRLTSGGAMGMGATFRSVTTFLSQRIEAEGIVTEYEPNRKCSYKITSGPVQGENSLMFEPTESGTKVTNSGSARLGILGLMKSLIASKARKQLINDLKTLKKVLERGS
jgi:uncharacterized membrane protein